MSCWRGRRCACTAPAGRGGGARGSPYSLRCGRRRPSSCPVTSASLPLRRLASSSSSSRLNGSARLSWGAQRMMGSSGKSERRGAWGSYIKSGSVAGFEFEESNRWSWSGPVHLPRISFSYLQALDPTLSSYCILLVEPQDATCWPEGAVTGGSGRTQQQRRGPSGRGRREPRPLGPSRGAGPLLLVVKPLPTPTQQEKEAERRAPARRRPLRVGSEMRANI